jgi:glutathione S-transferase
MALRIIGKSTSINVRKVFWLCAEIGAQYEHEEGTLQDIKALNPNAMVPVLREGDFTMWESNAILRYIASTRGATDLLPANAKNRAKVDQWMDWQVTELNNAWRYAFMAIVRKSPAHTNATLVFASVAQWNRHMQMLDHQLTKTGSYVTGSSFTLADIVLGLATHRWYMTPIEQRPALAAVEAYYERLSQRPPFKLHGRNGVP